LLMAFPLFNVVVGVDKRCIKNALLLKTKLEYRKIASLDEIHAMGIDLISPSDYLEKIFQIPFELKEANPESLNNLVDHLLKSQLESSGESKPEVTAEVHENELIADSDGQAIGDA